VASAPGNAASLRFPSPNIEGEEVQPAYLQYITHIWNLRDSFQGRGKPSPYPRRSAKLIRIGYGLGLPLPWIPQRITAQ